MHYRSWFSEEQITNNDEFCLKRPITKLDHFRLDLARNINPPKYLQDQGSSLVFPVVVLVQMVFLQEAV